MKHAFAHKLAVMFVSLAAVSAITSSAQNVAVTKTYEGIANQLTTRIQNEMIDKKLPALSIALVDDQTVVWAQGFGFEDADKKIAATAHSVYRVGSVSKLFTDIAVMQLVERGQVDLDAPVTRYLPGFKPASSFPGAITLRELMSHRSGLVREPPIGHYFDASSPSLQATVDSLNKTALVFAPGTHTKYSNAGVATVGYVLQQLAKTPYPGYLKEAVLQPIGMNESAFSPEPTLIKHLVAGEMWSYDGLSFSAPAFQLGEGPAGAMYSTVTDLGKFASAIFAGGKVITPGTLSQMLTPQFSSGNSKNSYGLGFRLGDLDGESEAGHGGAIYGYATQLAVLPHAKLGVIVIAAADSANAVTQLIADDALRVMLAQRNHQALVLPPMAHTTPVETTRELAGDYEADDDRIHIEDQEGVPYLRHLNGGSLMRLASTSDDELILDSRVAYSRNPIGIGKANGNAIETIGMAGKEYRRIEFKEPAAATDAQRGLIGEYGWDFDKLYILEDNGKLNMLVEWFEFEPLEPLSADEYSLPDQGLYVAEKLKFSRDAAGQVTGLQLGGVTFPKRPEAAAGSVFQITPLKPVVQLRREALAAAPPHEAGEFRKPDLVELADLDPTIKLDIRYASTRNFLGSPLYLQPRAFMQRPAAEAVVRASKKLHAMGYGLLIHDSYRPWYVTKMFWDGTPDDKKIFVADPSKGSRHNRGCAVDLTLYELKTGMPIEMTGGYDEMSERSYPFYPGGTSLQRWQRDRLRRAMESEGFTVYEFEWWHFDYKDWSKYPILNLTFEQLEKPGQSAAK